MIVDKNEKERAKEMFPGKIREKFLNKDEIMKIAKSKNWFYE